MAGSNKKPAFLQQEKPVLLQGAMELEVAVLRETLENVQEVRQGDFLFWTGKLGKQQAVTSATSRQQKSVIASSSQESAPLVLDGNLSTAWKANKGEYITFALENNASPNSIAIAWKEKSKDAKFEIQLSGGGGQFLTVYEGTVEATNELKNYRFKGTTASDIRIVITSGNASISEVKIKELKN